MLQEEQVLDELLDAAKPGSVDDTIKVFPDVTRLDENKTSGRKHRVLLKAIIGRVKAWVKAELLGKSDTDHRHAIGDVEGLGTALDDHNSRIASNTEALGDTLRKGDVATSTDAAQNEKLAKISQVRQVPMAGLGRATWGTGTNAGVQATDSLLLSIGKLNTRSLVSLTVDDLAADNSAVNNAKPITVQAANNAYLPRNRYFEYSSGTTYKAGDKVWSEDTDYEVVSNYTASSIANDFIDGRIRLSGQFIRATGFARYFKKNGGPFEFYPYERFIQLKILSENLFDFNFTVEEGGPLEGHELRFEVELNGTTPTLIFNNFFSGDMSISGFAATDTVVFEFLCETTGVYTLQAKYKKGANLSAASTGGTGTGTSETAESIKTKLQSLTGEARLDASAIKNLPTGGGTVDETFEKHNIVSGTATITVTNNNDGAIWNTTTNAAGTPSIITFSGTHKANKCKFIRVMGGPTPPSITGAVEEFNSAGIFNTTPGYVNVLAVTSSYDATGSIKIYYYWR
ncbi:hypothetical protein [Pontibacter rugosus]|uniref:Uncharacterized protein n=1 Tax=Pontibacter rugosus TaxID=1745966 RepID=A0ABW3SJT7_9BACT